MLGSRLGRNITHCFITGCLPCHLRDLQRGPDKTYLEGLGDLVSRLITPITHIVTLVIPVINLLTKAC